MALITETKRSVMESDNSTRYSACDSRSYPEEALDLPYYHPTLASMRQVRDLLFEYLNSTGFFLLRKSFTKSSTLTISVVFSHAIKHFTISQKETGSYFLQDKLFASIKDLVGYYGRHEVPNKEKILGVYLRHPVPDLQRHQFFASSYKQVASADEAKAETWTRNSYKDIHEGQKSDRVDHIRLTSQSFPVKVAHLSKNPDCGNGNRPIRSRTVFAQISSPDRPLSGYLQLDLPKESEAEPRASAIRPASVCGGTGWAGRKCPGLEPELPADRSLTNEQPTRFSFQSKSLQDRPHSHQQPRKDAHQSVAESSNSMLAPKAPHALYCYARSPYTQLATALVDRLREIEGENATKCQCGIYHDDAELPRGWSFHRSTEPETYGQVLFTGPDGESDWNLPLDVSLELSADQQDKIRDLICRPPPRPCSHFFDAVGRNSDSAATADDDSGYQALFVENGARDINNHDPAEKEEL